MEQYVLLKSDLNHWVELILRGSQVFVPSRAYGEIFFLPHAGRLEFDLLNGTAVLPYLPPKDIVSPQSETMFSFTRHAGDVTFSDPEKVFEKSVILGIRSCDTTGIHWLDNFYSNNFRDSYYHNRRDNLTLVTFACNEPMKNCFCICCEGGPFLNPEKDAFDLQFIDFDERYLVECNSEKGKELIDLNRSLFSQPELAIVEARDQLENKSRTLFLPEPTSYMSTAIRRITSNSVPPEVWAELGERCFDDGGCTFVCPCCSCFGVGYVSKGEAGCHYRFWDSCDYSGFTREVSGHNPRADKGERFKRRFFHKLSYQYIKRDGRIGCVGCGRCITACPGEVGMPAVVERLRRG
jgi:sulfhydrogenase subunit beta (sulfur reductase)